MIIQNIYNALENIGSLKQNTVECIMCCNKFRVWSATEENWKLIPEDDTNEFDWVRKHLAVT